MAALPALGAVASVASAGIGAIGAISSANASAASARYQAQVAANNSVIANQNAAYATQAGEQQTTNAGLRDRATRGAVRTGLAANNIDINTGSPRDVQEGVAETGQLDTETTRQKAALLAYGYRSQSTNFTAQAGLDTAQAGFDETAGRFKAVGSLLSGASAVSGLSGNLFPTSSDAALRTSAATL